MFGWTKKKNNEALDKLLPILKIVDAELEKIKHQLDMLTAKVNSKFFKEKKKEEDLEDKTETLIKDDGFQEVRELRKSGII